MKSNQTIPLVLIVLFAGSVIYYVMDFDSRVKVEVTDDLNFNIEQEVESALKDALSKVDDTLEGIDQALEEVDEIMEEIDETIEDLDEGVIDTSENLDELMENPDSELRGIHRGLDDILDEVQREIETSENLRIERKMSKEEIGIVKKKVKSIVKRIIAEAINDEPKLEKRP